MNLLIFLDITYNPGINFRFYSLQGQNFKIFLIFTYNQDKVFLILPITLGAHVYLVSIGSCPAPLAKYIRSDPMATWECAKQAQASPKLLSKRNACALHFRELKKTHIGRHDVNPQFAESLA